MSAITKRALRLYASDGAFTGSILLAIGLLGPVAGFWARLVAA